MRPGIHATREARARSRRPRHDKTPGRRRPRSCGWRSLKLLYSYSFLLGLSPGVAAGRFDDTPPAIRAKRPHPAGDGPPDLVRRIFLEEMDPRDLHFGLRWPPPDEVEI